MLSFKFTSKKIWREIDRSHKILLHLHPGPDGDSVGSALAFYHVLKNIGKDVSLIQGDNSLPTNLSTLPGADKILPQNIFQVDLTQFDLFIILDSSSPRQVTRLGEFKFPKNLKTIVIDHHSSNEKFGKINLVVPHSPATAQVLFDFFAVRNIKITPKIAACLYAGIYTDSGGFKYVGTTHKTLTIASQLAKIYPKFSQLIFDIENNDPPERLKLISLLLASIEVYYSDQVALASLSYQDIKTHGLEAAVSASYSDVANMIKSVIGWNIALVFVEIQPQTVKVSFRTRDSQTYDLSKIALATKSGGGHRAAAGATINKSLPEAKTLVLQTIKKLYPKIDKI
ncbi:MAG TPA: DHH family phosphoesterase [Candidatus Woesebacteria bacterium]|jgi:phosphoesterase RecJ-like protein|nr:DHH family phosphoesterase [Candidatus Shapirobacteria bacterium]HOR02073.1 DHH family phosphoesterase [Candidatus Woesebacteria bacterium]